jgi:hypothetical protein
VRLEFTGGRAENENEVGAEDASRVAGPFGAEGFDLRRFQKNAIPPATSAKITIPAMVAPAITPALERVLDADVAAEVASSYLQFCVRQT